MNIYIKAIYVDIVGEHSKSTWAAKVWLEQLKEQQKHLRTYGHKIYDLY